MTNIDFIIGDSIAAGTAINGFGLKNRSGAYGIKSKDDKGISKVGAPPNEILGFLNEIGKAQLTGKNIILSCGISNGPGKIEIVKQQLNLLKEVRATVFIIGVSNNPPDNLPGLKGMNATLEKIASDYGYTFFGGFEPSADRIHPNYSSYYKTNIKPVLDSGKTPASSNTAPASTDTGSSTGLGWKSYDIQKSVSLINKTKHGVKPLFADSLKLVLYYIKNDPAITDVREAAYLLGTAFAESGYSLGRFESDYVCKGSGIPYGPEGPCSRATNYYKSSVPKKKQNYYLLGTDLKGQCYFGRGLIQLTGKGNYEKFGKKIGIDLASNGDLAMVPENSYKVASTFMRERTFSKVLGNNLTSARKSVNGGTNGLAEVNAAYQDWVNVLKSAAGGKDTYVPPVGSTTPPVATVPSTQPTSVSNDPAPQETSRGNEKEVSNPGGSVEAIVPGLSNIFPPTIKVEPIKIENKKKKENDKYLKDWAKTIGVRPFVWYNGFQISDGDIEFFSLYHIGILPCITLTFRDTFNIMKDKGFPVDDTRIKIFLSSRTQNIRHILLEFKIKNFSVNGASYTIIGTLNVNEMYLKRFKSYSSKTSFFALQDICKESELGFNSNISDSNDKMTWINTGQKVCDFMDSILSNSYISDEGFAYGYIDFFYNFNYVDIEKELTRDITEDRSVNTSGISKDVTGDDKKIYKILLTNDHAIKESDMYISEYKILNNSTSVSLEKGYLNTSKHYDSIKKEYLIFDVDSITSEGSKTIIMKGSPQDEKFYKDNVTTTYTGKLDSDNMHSNYNYAHTHNMQNIEDLQKIGIVVKLPNPNYNLYRFQKLKLAITNKGGTPTNDLKNERISGEWFITDIKFIYNQGTYYQEISLIKRELELSEEEINNESKASAADSTPPENTKDVVENTTNPTDLKNTDAPASTDPTPTPAVQSTQTPTPTSPPKPADPLKTGKLLVVSGKLKYIASSGKGIAGHRLIKIIDELSAYLNSKGFKTKLGNNGICRDLAAASKGGGARAAGSLHGAGIAIDLLFGPAYKKDYYIYNRQGVKLKWLSIGDNKNLSQDIELTKTIWAWVKTQGDITWGAEWGEKDGTDIENGIIRGHGITEYHHFEIKKSLIPTYWEPFKTELSNLGFDPKKLVTTTKLGELYSKLTSSA